MICRVALADHGQRVEKIGEHGLVGGLGRRAAAEQLEDGAERVGVALAVELGNVAQVELVDDASAACRAT